jgi:hypothetical protein
VKSGGTASTLFRLPSLSNAMNSAFFRSAAERAVFSEPIEQYIMIQQNKIN